MFNFKGIRAYYHIAMIMLVFQMLKLITLVKSVEAGAAVAAGLIIGWTVKLVIFDKKFREAKYWLLLIFLFAQVVILGLDKILPERDYCITVSCMLFAGVFFIMSLDAPSIRKQMDEDAYILKNSCSGLTMAYAASVIGMLMNYIFPPDLPI